MDYGTAVGMGMAMGAARRAEDEAKKMRAALDHWKKRAQQLQATLDGQVIETARMGVLRVVILDELLKIKPDHWLKDKEKRVALANDKRLVAKEVTEMGRPDLVDRV